MLNQYNLTGRSFNNGANLVLAMASGWADISWVFIYAFSSPSQLGIGNYFNLATSEEVAANSLDLSSHQGAKKFRFGSNKDGAQFLGFLRLARFYSTVAYSKKSSPLTI